nr:hypothetical protein [Tanacetum cinerariifolium]
MANQEQPFVVAKQVGFNLEDIILNANNKVALLYPEHNNKDYFKCVFGFISKCCLRKPFTRSPNMCMKYMAEFWYSAKALENSKPSVSKGGSSKAPTGSKTGHSKKRKESSSAMDSNLSQPPVCTPVDTKMHKEDQQAIGGPTYLGVTSEERANPQLSSGNDASAASTAKVDPGNSTPSDFVPQQQCMNEGIKNTSYDYLFADLDSPEDDPVIVVDDSDEDEDDEVYATKNVETEDVFLNSRACQPDGRFSKTITSLTSQFAELKTLQWEQPVEFLDVPSQVKMVQAKLKTLDALPSLLNKVTNALNQFAQAITLKKTRGDSVPSAGQADTQHVEGEKNTNQAIIS